MGPRPIEGQRLPSDAISTPSGDAAIASAEITGTRAGMIVFVGIAATNAANSLFHLIAARSLGPAEYSDLVSLLALSGLIALPLGALQIAVARSVARDLSLGRRAEITARARQGVAISLAIGVGVAVVLLAATPLIKRVLEINASLPVVLTAVLTIPSLLAPALWGVAQGLQRFVVISGTATLGAALRVALLAVAIPLSLTVDGALMVTVVASTVTAPATILLLAPVLRRPAVTIRHSHLEFLRETAPVAMGTLAITALTTFDLIVAKVVLPSAEAGEYGSASLLGRLILYVPATIATVLLPKVSSRAAVERGTTDILRASLVVTVAISLLATLLLATVPGLVLDASFGSEFDDAAPLLWLFGIAMTQYAVLNVLLVHDLGHHSSRVAWLLLGGAAVQLVGYALFHDSAHELLYVSIATGSTLLVLYAFVVEPAVRRRLVRPGGRGAA